MQTVLITGANGFVGNYLSEKLAQHANVIATGKGDCRLSFTAPTLRYVELDITAEAQVETVLFGVKPDCIIHCAAISKPDLCEQDHALADGVNVDATRHLLAHAGGAHFIYLSTDFVFDGAKGFYREDDEQSPVNYYGLTKKRAEELVHGYAGPWTIVRTVLVYGAPRAGRGNLLTMVADALAEGKSLRIFSDQLRTPTYVEDLVDALVKITLEHRAGTWHVSGADARTPFEMAVATARLLGLDETLIAPETEQTFAQPARRPPKTGFDISKAVRELDYKPTSFEEGLRKTFSIDEGKNADLL
ncbi:MAG: SDR family oxidoreductase [Chitinophagaceae bacterium]|nr:MAG: SDR family oxidoreductase [Chitinophagaceae bacterium]